MSLTKPEPPARALIQEPDVKRWSKRWRVEPEKIRAAISLVGNSQFYGRERAYASIIRRTKQNRNLLIRGAHAFPVSDASPGCAASAFQPRTAPRPRRLGPAFWAFGLSYLQCQKTNKKVGIIFGQIHRQRIVRFRLRSYCHLTRGKRPRVQPRRGEQVAGVALSIPQI
jgi:hypothetical protein